MAQIVWAESALLDLNDVAEYIALDKPSAARRLVQDIFARIDLLEQAPKSGGVPPELKRSRYREFIVGPRRVFYQPTAGSIFVLHVMRSERMLRKYILSERENENR
jgi:toxin ParE1/3/4